jgi:hypothetical protein
MQQRVWGRLAAVALVMAGGLSRPLPAVAQGTALGTVQGVVSDETGAVLAHARVAVGSSALPAGPRSTLTSQSGRFRIGGLPAGLYNITVSADGFAETRVAPLELAAGSTMTVDVVLDRATLSQTVTVEAAPPVVDVTRPSMLAMMDTDALSNLPTDRSLTAQVNLAPGVTRSVGLGGTIGSNALAVGGVDVTDPRTQAPLVSLPALWTESLEVGAPGADVEQGGFTGISASASLRAGGNDLSGTLEWWAVAPSWVDQNVDEVSPREIDQWWDLGIVTGGPIARGRLWAFGGFDLHRLEDRPAGFAGPGARDERTPRAVARLSATAGNAAHLDGFVAYGRLKQELADVGPFVDAAVASDLARRDLTWNLRAVAALGQRVLLEAGYGGYDSNGSISPHPPGTRAGPAPRLDFGTFELSGNARRYSDSDARRHALRSTVTWVVGGRDEHEIRAGGEYEWSEAIDRSGTPGNVEYRDFFGRPLNAMFWNGDSTTASGRRAAVWARDQWRAHPDLTVTAGVRFDANRGSVPGRGVVLRTNPVSPRVGLAWDVAGRHRTAVKLHYGRYTDALLLNPVAFLDAAGLSPRIFARPDASGTYVEYLRVTPDASNRRVDPGLDHSAVSQFVAGAEHALGRSVVARLFYLHRQYDDFMAQVDTGSMWEPVTRADPGPDGVYGTGDDGGTIGAYTLLNFGSEAYLLTNPPGARRDYDALQFSVVQRYRGRWQGQASVTWARTGGTIGNGDFTNAAVNDTGILYGTSNPGIYLTPNGQVNAHGRAPYTFSEAKLLATWHAPWLGGFTCSGVFRAYSGTRWERFVSYTDLGVPGVVTVRVEPRGSRGLPAVRNLDVRVAKDVLVGRGTTVSVYADVLNLTNQGTPQFASGGSGPNFGQPGAYPDPRLVRAGVRLTF